MFRWAAALVIAMVVGGGLVAPAALTAPPSGATAVCRDGTYSFSSHHSGTCSHHGGVAKWLDGSGVSSGGSSSASGASTAEIGSVRVGHTVLLGKRTRTSGCRLGAEPDRRCSPGAYYTGLTKAILCSPGFHTSSIRNVPDSEKHQVEIEYGLLPERYGRSLEIDHIVSLELGGSNDVANLFPEEAVLPGRAPGYHVKDELENRLHAMVCDGSIGLRTAQRRIASNWQALYEHAFGREAA